MTFKEFCAWCNERACDGRWSGDVAKICCLVIVNVRKARIWRREKLWRIINYKLKIEELYVKPTDARREVFLNER